LRQYELTYIIRPDLDEEATAAVAERVEQVINANGGRVLKTDRWGKRRLAYTIQNYNEGFYLLLLTELGDVAIREIERHMKLSEDIIRHLLVRVEAEEAEEAEAEEAAEVAEEPEKEAAAEEAAAPAEAEEAAAEEAAEPAEKPEEEAGPEEPEETA
jgi:small subunit ribosomal protein S6